MNVTVLDHPLINHYMTIIRNKNTSSSEFKSLAKKVSVLMGFEVFKELLVNNHKIETPIENYRGIKIKGTRNEAGCNSVYVAGKIIEKIGPILAIKSEDFSDKHVVEKFN